MKRERAIEIAAKAKRNIDALEAHPLVKQDKDLRKLVHAVHKDEQTILEEVGPLVGLTGEDVVVYGGGTPKTPEDEK